MSRAVAPLTGAVPREGEAAAAAIERIDAAAERLTTPCGAGKMVWRRWGSGPVLVLLHGGHGSWRHWIRTVPAFANHRTVLAPDLPGLGESDSCPGEIPEATAAAVVAGLRLVVTEGQPFDLVGFSFGALVAGHVAAALGPSLRSLTLVGAGALGLRRGHVDLLSWKADMTPDQVIEVHRTNLERLMHARPETIDEMALLIQAHNTRHSRVRSRKVAFGDSLAQALRRSAPQKLDMVWGELDSVAGPYLDERRQFIRSLRPDAGFHVVPGAGHWVAYETPDLFNALLSRLLHESATAG